MQVQLIEILKLVYQLKSKWFNFKKYEKLKYKRIVFTYSLYLIDQLFTHNMHY